MHIQKVGLGIGIDRSYTDEPKLLTSATTDRLSKDKPKCSTNTATNNPTDHLKVDTTASESGNATSLTHITSSKCKLSMTKEIKIVLKRIQMDTSQCITISQEVLDSIPRSKYRPEGLYIHDDETPILTEQDKTNSSSEETIAYSSAETELYWPLSDDNLKSPDLKPKS